MIVSVINLTNGRITDEQIHPALRAINRQIAEDFQPYWSINATLRLEGRGSSRPDKRSYSDMRGDAILYLWDKIDVEGALGYHELNNRGIPYGIVFVEISDQLEESWTVTFSHEALELIADPESNLLVAGPHPQHPHKYAFYWFEICDAVQGDSYLVDGVAVCNFVLPMYFTHSGGNRGRIDFLGIAHDGQTLSSFGVNPGGYVGYFDPTNGDHATYSRDDKARRRQAIKSGAHGSQRANKYQHISALSSPHHREESLRNGIPGKETRREQSEISEVTSEVERHK